ncbi:YjbH domain-containing protein [Aliiroseovarius subalbicans]|uniref:YjbH domain-containing protein n=1 Tax=Aliiroseovarius subalbicans TaxID=2925840 RepID=UPI001F58C2A5|nr:YjbH domain-containing protein [Aliiroseovarius subalbicans]MCI2397795.1 YjbH domain-containing protein [Aliiroseovarius subalbicans]
MFGMPGLVEMPTAEAAPSGHFSFTYGTYGPFGRGTMAFQVTPRLTASFRYSSIAGYLPADPDYVNYDRSFDLRFRVLDESKYLPAVSIGLQDFMGTTPSSSEYIVATKSIGDRLRVTGGIGWGRLGSLNAIGATGVRPPRRPGPSGYPNYYQWFQGDFAAFGGVSYKVNDKITLKAEYSSDAYTLAGDRGYYTRNSPFNFGVDYALAPGWNLAAYYMYGNQIGLQFSVAMNPNRPTSHSGTEEAPHFVRPRPSRSADPEAWGTDWVNEPETGPGLQAALATALGKTGITLNAMALTATRAELRVTNNRYNSEAQALGRTFRIMTRAFPASVETFVVTLMRNGTPLSSVTMSRSDIERLEHAPAPEAFAAAQITDAAGRPDGMTLTPGLYPRFNWSLAPYFSIGLFGGEQAVSAELGLRLAGSYEITPGLVLSASLKKTILSNFVEATSPSDSVLPHVRSDVGLYNAQGDPSLEHLTLAWYARPARDLYSRVTFGYLEPMFAGVSAEVLWKPVDSRLGLGAELAYVVQRDYDQLLGLRDYSTVTGHVSAYYDFGNGFETQLDVGRYLAGDFGATVSIDRTFANGWKVGAYATFTDVSAEDFGEGSFDKGVRFSVPMEWALGKPSRTNTQTTIMSLARDGGAQLRVEGRLFDWVNEGHGDALAARWGRFWR